jgi:hypothetical protein
MIARRFPLKPDRPSILADYRSLGCGRFGVMGAIASMTINRLLLAVLICAGFSATLPGQQPAAPTPQPAHIAGTVTDTNGDVIPEAVVLLEGSGQNSRTVVANDNGFFQIDDVAPGGPYHVTVSAKGFADWKSPEALLQPGQFDLLSDVKLTMLAEATSVTVVASREDLAVTQLTVEEHQRVLGFIPNFYVSYDKDAVPLTPKLKFELALRVSVDPVTFAGTSFLAATNQAARYPDYVEGWKGYGQRFGAVYANDLTDIMVGGAILPSILHQDPRYFYQGTGTTKSRLMHALSSPIICKGDNGRWQPNYSSLGGYLASGAIANAYYPPSNRGAGLVLNTFAVDFSANIANGVLQEFVLRKLTPNAKNRN